MKKSINHFTTHSLTHSHIFSTINHFIFCTEKPPTDPNELKNKSTLAKSGSDNDGLNLSVKGDTTKSKDKNKDKGIIIVPNAASQCQKVVYSWEFDHYETVTGKIVGIWPEEHTLHTNTYKLFSFHDTLGFNRLLTLNGWINNAQQQGWTPNQLMIGGFTLSSNWESDILNNPVSWAYYFDEPYSLSPGQCTAVGNEMNEVRNHLNLNNRENSLLISGDTKCDYVDCFDNPCNIVTCTKYCTGIFCLNTDQRSLWTSFKERFQSKFDMVWISSRLDNNEFDNLVGHANNLGVNGVWLFQADDEQASDITERSRIEQFSLFAWKWGFLTKVERKWTYVYECMNQNPCDCNPNAITGEWILVDKYPSWETRTVSYY